MINPTLYKLKVRGEGQVLLVFAESYHSLWTANVNGQQIRSVPVYDMVNGFPLYIDGEETIYVEFSLKNGCM